MAVVDAVNKPPNSQLRRPPYTGARHDPVPPGPGGHFDHLDPDSRAFAYATVRRVLDIWEDYFGHRIEWHFESDFARLELIPLVVWDNAQSGYGFLEFGYGTTPDEQIDFDRPFCMNLDVLAHELGHSIVFSEVGVPASPTDPGVDYGGMHESAGDLVAIVAALHFDSVVDHLLESTRGNLFTVNELDRIGELSDSREIRVAFNSLRMSDVDDQPHDRSLPLTGGVFDVMVEVFQKDLVARDVITKELAERSTQGPGPGRDQNLDAVQADFDAAYDGHEAEFKDALLVARLLAGTWSGMSPDFLTYHAVLRRMLRADRDVSGGVGKYQDTIRECFAWREISLLPGSVMLRPHTVKACGLAAESGGGPAVEDVVRAVLARLAAGAGAGQKVPARRCRPRGRSTPGRGPPRGRPGPARRLSPSISVSLEL